MGLKTPENEQTAKLLRRRQAELGLTHAELAQRITENGYEVSTETVARWTRTGAIPLAALALGGSAIAVAYEMPKALLGLQEEPIEYGTAATVADDGTGDYDSANPELFIHNIDRDLKRLDELYAELKEAKASQPNMPMTRNGYLSLAAFSELEIEQDIKTTVEHINRQFGNLGRQFYHRFKKEKHIDR